MEDSLKCSLLQLLGHAKTKLDGINGSLNRADLPLTEVAQLISIASQVMPPLEILEANVRSATAVTLNEVLSVGPPRAISKPEQEPQKNPPEQARKTALHGTEPVPVGPSPVVPNPEQQPHGNPPEKAPDIPVPLILKVESSSSSEEEDNGKEYKMRFRGVLKKGFKCIYCSKIVSTERYLKDHIRTMHSRARPFVCTKCNRKYCLKQTLSRHIKQKHNKQQS